MPCKTLTCLVYKNNIITLMYNNAKDGKRATQNKNRARVFERYISDCCRGKCLEHDPDFKLFSQLQFTVSDARLEEFAIAKHVQGGVWSKRILV